MSFKKGVDVREHGAKGDGATDDQAAIQAAATAAIASQDDLVIPWTPDGYRLASTVTLNGRVRVRGRGNIQPDDGIDAFTVTGDNVEIDGVVGTASLAPASNTRFIFVDGATNFRAIDCRFTGATRQIWLEQTIDAKVVDNWFMDADEWGLIANGPNGLIVMANHAEGCGHDGIKVSGEASVTAKATNNVIILGNHCYGNGRDGIDCALNGGKNIVVKGNICRDNTLYGIDFKTIFSGDLQHVSIEGNLCTATAVSASGINVQNDVAGMTLTNPIVAGNYIHVETTAAHGLRVSGAKDAHVVGNYIASAYRGIRLVDCDTPVIMANRVRFGSLYCLGLDSQGFQTPTGAIIKDNVMRLASNNNVVEIGANVENTLIYENHLSTSGAGSLVNDAGTNTEYLEGLPVVKADFDAQSILAAILENTPVNIAIAEGELVGRPSGGNVGALTADQVRAIIGDAAAATRGLVLQGAAVADLGAQTVNAGTDTVDKTSLDTAIDNIQQKLDALLAELRASAVIAT